MTADLPLPAVPDRAVVGVDGFRGRWVTVTARPDGQAHLDVVDHLGPLAERVRAGQLAAMAIDMPIGLLDDGPRPCDLAARARLGARRSSVFPAPARATLAALDYPDACDRNRAVLGTAISKQAFHILGPIRHLDEIIGPGDGATIVEAHPELAFARLAGEPLASKHRPEGRQRREELLRAALGSTLDDLLDQRVARRVPLVDVLDAAVLTLTARHVVAGTEHRLGGELDPTGKPAQVVY